MLFASYNKSLFPHFQSQNVCRRRSVGSSICIFFDWLVLVLSMLVCIIIITYEMLRLNINSSWACRTWINWKIRLALSIISIYVLSRYMYKCECNAYYRLGTLDFVEICGKFSALNIQMALCDAENAIFIWFLSFAMGFLHRKTKKREEESRWGGISVSKSIIDIALCLHIISLFLHPHSMAWMRNRCAHIILKYDELTCTSTLHETHKHIVLTSTCFLLSPPIIFRWNSLTFFFPFLHLLFYLCSFHFSILLAFYNKIA